MTDTFLTSAELAKRWRMTTGALSNRRARGAEPPYVKPSGRMGDVLYRISDVEEYERANTVLPARGKSRRTAAVAPDGEPEAGKEDVIENPFA